MLRLNPRADGIGILAGGLSVDPTPAERHERTDRFGNRVTQVSFAGFFDLLRIESRFDVDTISVAPLHDPGLPRLPWSTSPTDRLARLRPHPWHRRERLPRGAVRGRGPGRHHAPVEGGFHGNGVTAALDYRVQISTT